MSDEFDRFIRGRVQQHIHQQVPKIVTKELAKELVNNPIFKDVLSEEIDGNLLSSVVEEQLEPVISQHVAREVSTMVNQMVPIFRERLEVIAVEETDDIHDVTIDKEQTTLQSFCRDFEVPHGEHIKYCISGAPISFSTDLSNIPSPGDSVVINGDEMTVTQKKRIFDEEGNASHWEMEVEF